MHLFTSQNHTGQTLRLKPTDAKKHTFHNVQNAFIFQQLSTTHTIKTGHLQKGTSELGAFTITADA